MYISELDDADRIRYWPSIKPMRYLYVFARIFLASMAVSTLCLIANRIWQTVMTKRHVQARVTEWADPK
jgi:hypothetical protein